MKSSPEEIQLKIILQAQRIFEAKEKALKASVCSQ